MATRMIGLVRPRQSENSRRALSPAIISAIKMPWTQAETAPTACRAATPCAGSRTLTEGWCAIASTSRTAAAINTMPAARKLAVEVALDGDEFMASLLRTRLFCTIAPRIAEYADECPLQSKKDDRPLRSRRFEATDTGQAGGEDPTGAAEGLLHTRDGT